VWGWGDRDKSMSRLRRTLSLLSARVRSGQHLGNPYLVGMGALAAGIGIGVAVPTQWFQAKEERSLALLPDKTTRREDSAVYEDVREIAEDIPRPAIIVDATRQEVEARYEFHSCLASGGSATVWRATELGTGRAVAIKVVDKKLLQEAFLNMEVASLRRCAGHPNIMQLLAAYDVCGDAVCPDGEWHLVMELAEGGELFERLLTHGAYTEKVASQLLRQVARGIYHLHSCGIVHRDIKPENVVLMSKDADSPVKLIDFGAAVLLEENEQVIAGGKVGTWTYWAPEQVDEQRAYDQQVDMWSLGILLYIMLSGRHPFERANIPSGQSTDNRQEDMLHNILHARYSFDSAQWSGISGRARQLVRQLMEPDPKKRLSAAELLTHPWVLGEDVPERPLPETVERLRAFKTASAAIHGSLLMAALLYQESVREQVRFEGDRGSGGSGSVWVFGIGGGGSTNRTEMADGKALLRRSTTEGIGMLESRRGSEFNVVRAAYNLFDPDDKGYIISDDLYRVCHQLGFAVSERDVENMLSVLAPTDNGSALRGGLPSRAISYDKFAKMMESSYRRRFRASECIFRQGDAVDGFYIVVSGECSVQVSARQGEAPKEIAQLGPGDFFGETGLLEGRVTRNTDVVCKTPVEVLMIGNQMFLHLTDSPSVGAAGAAIAGRMRERAEARQRSRLTRAIEMMQSAPLQPLRFRKGDILFRQGDPATHFYILKTGQLTSSFVASTGEAADLGVLSPGMHFGYDSVLGEVHDTTVRCLTNAEVLAVPREQLQKAFTQDTYLQSVWQAPAKKSIRLRRELSQALADHSVTGRSSMANGGGLLSDSPLTAPSADRLQAEDFEPMLRRARMCTLANGEVAFEQGSPPCAVYLLREGECHVEHTSQSGHLTTVVGKLSAGDHFGEGALLEGRESRRSTVRCVDPAGCRLGVLGKGAFEAMLRAQPELVSVFESTLARRYRAVIQLAVDRSDCETVSLSRGEVLFSQGEMAEAFFVVDSGAVQMAYRTSDGRQLPVRTHRAGDVFGASGLLAGDGTRRDTAIAIEPTVLKAIPHSRFQTLMRQDSLLAEGLRRATTSSRLDAPPHTAGGSPAGQRAKGTKNGNARLREAPAWSGHALVGKHRLEEGNAARGGQ